MFFEALGRFIARFWALILGLWIAGTAVLMFWTRDGDISGAQDQSRFLPATADSMLAKRLLDRYFPGDSFGSRAVLVIERESGLRPDDIAWLDEAAENIEALGLHNVRKILTPAKAPPLMQIKLLSADGKAALAVISFSTNFVSKKTKTAVRALLPALPQTPPGLKNGFTGDAAVGSDYHRAMGMSVHKTTWATLLMLLIILLFIFRSPVTPLISLISIGAAFWAAKSLVALLAAAGASVSSLTEIFLIVMIFGAGTDYCVFLIFRYYEELRAGKDSDKALIATMRGVGGAISSSAMTVIIGVGCLIFAAFGPFNRTGPYIALGIAVALLAGLTLTPSLILALRKILFWPSRNLHHELEPRAWKRVIGFITDRPWATATVLMLGLLPLAVFGMRAQRSFDLFSELPENFPSRQGMAMLQSHFEQGQMSPLTLVLRSKQALNGPEGWNRLHQFSRLLEDRKEIREVLSVTQPTGDPKVLERALLGSQAQEWHAGLERLREGNAKILAGVQEKTSAMPFFLGAEKESLEKLNAGLSRMGAGLDKAVSRSGLWIASLDANPSARNQLVLPPDAPQRFPEWKQALDYYVSPDGHATRLTLVLRSIPFSDREKDDILALKPFLASAATTIFPEDAEFHLAGAGATVLDERLVTDGDFRHVLLYVLGGIFLVLLILLREWKAPVYLVLSMVLSYFVSLGITSLVFERMMGHAGGLDWKVPFFMFVLLVALGEDYNIFLMARIQEERKKAGLLKGVRTATVRTGPLITYCGLIMAVTFLSLMLSPLTALMQLGFGITVGMLLDTFVVRPLLVPSLVLITAKK